jgi:LPXTG-site transpeptidase (sortase) family protein
LGPDSSAATRGDTRLAAGHSGQLVPAILLATGLIAIIAGLALLLTTFAPLFVQRSDSATVVAPAGTPARDDLGPSSAVEPSAPVPGPKPATIGGPPDAPIDGFSFELRIPVIGYRAMVHQGVGSNVLAHGPGHYPTTPWPGRPGNVGIAAHNVYWLSFNHLKVGDRVQIRTQQGLYLYEITGSRVTDPNDRTVLAGTSDYRLTLTTCYPLWAGAFATERLIFAARALGGVS